ncbi:cyclic-phosphate processing receiver domain-containing protein [Undibacterium flavidum]|uniref:cyclic-phosphate processing receiver domain-containing protein n=1 Tax=Undibacterium flavidum TaxID=2762297 RepID=UPI002E30114B|nr:cyclic-phosphate processing receiver domain-containing protein [Undibacterium flavidum]
MAVGLFLIFTNDQCDTGYDVVLWIEEEVALHGFIPPRMGVHSANSSARQKMEAGIHVIDRLFKK